MHTYGTLSEKQFYNWFGPEVTKSVIKPKEKKRKTTVRYRALMQEILLWGIRYSFEFPYVFQNRIPGGVEFVP